MGSYLKTIICSLIIIVSITLTAQDSQKKGIDLITNLINSESLELAEHEINEQIEQLKSTNQYDSLTHYIFPLGKLEILQKNEISRSITLAHDIEQNEKNSRNLSFLKLELGKVYFENNELSKAFEYSLQAKEQAEKAKNQELLTKSEYYMGDYAMRMGDIAGLEKNMRSAHKRILNNKGKPYAITTRVLNLMGGVMFFSSKLDSAQYFFESALKFVPNLEDNYENKLYLPAAIRGNLFMIKLNSGKHTEASKLAEESLQLNRKFLNEAPNHSLAARVKRNLALGYVNLSSLHFDLGDFERSENIMNLAYSFAQQNFEPKTEEYFLTMLGVAEVKVAKQESLKALPFLSKAEACLNNMQTDNNQLRAYLYNVYGEASYNLEEKEKALDYFKLSDTYYQKFNGDSYDSNRLYQSMNLGNISAELGHNEEAVAIVKRAYDYNLKENGANNYFANVLSLSLARINIELKEFQQALKWTTESLDIYNQNDSANGDDKIYFEEKKAEVILLNTIAKYELNKNKEVSFLIDLVADLEESILILETRKSLISSAESVNILINDNKEVFDFAKKLNLELFTKTKNLGYLNKALNLHESALYNRIRARLNLNNIISFSNIPEEIISKENQLRNELNVNPEEENSAALNKLLKSKANWKSFLDSLKLTYPKYYKMRYATIGESLENIQKNISKNTTVLRYFFVDEKLYVYVVSNEKEKLFSLDYADVETNINALGENQSNLEKTAPILSDLYTKLWKPFESEIKTKNIIIIPDGALYNLSFETLTPRPIQSFKELATNSLLARHNISYNYSLSLIDKSKKQKIYDNSFVGFAPEFNDAMKAKYQMAITDSLNADKTYLKLLQQPFNVNLAKAYGELFDGSYFLNENSTEQIFKANANEHKIIHIGTHAESNNISPELSRLIFAKDITNTTNEDGSLYTYEIYNTSLNSNLAILTACETGKPSYQAGEGMISLAHAFNYAGSESILTSLWKIDERSSAEILELFYDNIKSGKPKDEALRLAKLDYIRNIDGRTLAPQFWAGLVLMGDTSPIEISEKYNWLYWILTLVLVLCMGLYIRKRSRS